MEGAVQVSSSFEELGHTIVYPLAPVADDRQWSFPDIQGVSQALDEEAQRDVRLRRGKSESDREDLTSPIHGGCHKHDALVG